MRYRREVEAREPLEPGPARQQWLAEGLGLTVEYFRHGLRRRNRATFPTLDERLTSPGLMD